jgi:ABC-type nitrate/sulfonate/bicarbonate transport system substrate-binding protein
MATPQHRHAIRTSALVAAALTLMTTACSAPAGSSEKPSDGPTTPETIKIAFGSQPDFTQISNFKWIEDLESEYDVDVEELFFESSQDAFRAVVAGEADVTLGVVSTAMVLAATAPGDSVKLIAADHQAPDYILVTTPDVKSDADLIGKRTGISTPGDVSDTLTRVVLEERGVDTSQIDFVEIGGTSARMQALLSDQISAGAAHAAEGLSAVAQGLNNAFAYGESVPGYLQHGLMAPQAWLDENPEFAQTLVDTFIDSTRWAAENPEEYIEFSQDHVEGIDGAVRQEAYDIFTSIDMFAVDGGMEEEQLTTTAEIEQRVGTFGDDQAPELSAWTDVSYVEDYLARNGRFGE